MLVPRGGGCMDRSLKVSARQYCLLKIAKIYLVLCGSYNFYENKITTL